MSQFTLNILSPLHIGSGGVISPTGYLIDDYLYIIDMEKLFLDADFLKYRETFIKEAADSRYLGDLAPLELIKRHTLYRAGLKPETRTFLHDHPIEIKEFIKSAGRPYVPGSSIKGAVLSALLWYVLKEHAKTKASQVKALFAKENEEYRKNYETFLGLGFSLLTNSRGMDWKKARFLNWAGVSDSSFKKGNTEIIVTKVKGSKSTSELPIAYECLPVGSDFLFSLDLKKCKFSEEKVWEICDEFYSRVAAQYQNLKLDKEDGVFLRLGQGSSAFSTASIFLAHDLGISNYSVTPPLTTKTTLEGELMGWTVVKGENIRQTNKKFTALPKPKPLKEHDANDLAQAWGASLKN